MIKSFLKKHNYKLLLVGIFMANFLISNLFINIQTVYSAEKAKNIVLINSYNKGFTWTDNITEGVISTLNSSKFNINIYVEYIDWKNYPTKENLDNVLNTIKYKYAGKDIDIIMASDDAAVEFSFQHRKEIFGEIPPIVFCGVFKDTATALIEKYGNSAGVIERINPKGTLLTAFNINPKAEEVYVIHDKTESGLATFDIVKSAVNIIKKDVKVTSIDNLRIDNLDKDLPKLSKDSIVILTSFSRDENGKTNSHEKIAKLLSDKIDKPIYYVYDMGLGEGVLGGSILDSKLHGIKTAELALRILSGEKASSINLLDEKDYVNKYDYNVIKHFNIPLDQIPSDSIIINKPFSFYQTYKVLVWGVVSIFLLLLLLIIILINNVLKRKIAENELIKSNFELSEIYEELTASDDKLKYHYRELENSKEIIRKNEERYRLVFEISNDGLWDIDLNTNEKYFTKRWFDILGLNKDFDATVFENWKSIVHPDDIEILQSVFDEVYSGNEDNFSVEHRIIGESGDYKWVLARGKVLRDEFGKLHRITGSHSDINLKKLQEEQIKNLAYYDSLTGLANRIQIIDRVDEITEKISEKAALIFMDLDNFKVVNDSFGHTVGDQLLIEVSKRVLITIKDGDIVARLGGDEFAILLAGINDKQDVIDYLNTLLKITNDNVNINGTNISVSASLGVALFPEDGETFEELLRNADTAMYKAKEHGKRKYEFFEKSMNDSIIEKLLMQTHLSKALENNEFILHFQPQINLKNGKVYGFEALIRWESPIYGMVPPDNFIKLAEETGLIIEIGKWVLETACNFIKGIHDKGENELEISVNISVIQLSEDNFVSTIMEVIENTGIQHKHLNLEITESILMESIETNIKKFEELQEKGINISLDDFGKGYSSLTYLKEIPIDVLKIDKAFIDELIEKEEDKDIIGAIITLAHRLGMVVVAEGVETKEQYDYLMKNQCDIAQGYFISKPISAEAVIRLLDDYSD